MTEIVKATGRRKQRKGTVVSDKMDKSVVVAVIRVRRHPLYKKTVRSTKKYLAHSPQNDVHIGDRVLIEETRPLSKQNTGGSCRCWNGVSKCRNCPQRKQRRP